MTELIQPAAILLFAVAGNSHMSNIEPPIKVLDTIQGENFAAIRAGLKVLADRKLDLAKYEILIVRDVKSVTVIFLEKRKEAGAPKNFGVRLAPDTELAIGELNAVVAKLDQINLADRLQGSSYLPIPIAVGVFQEHKPDLAEYKIEVVRDGKSVVVIFTDKKREPGTRGIGVRPGFEVELSQPDLKVLRSNFVR